MRRSGAASLKSFMHARRAKTISSKATAMMDAEQSKALLAEAKHEIMAARCKSSAPLAEVDLAPCGYLKTEIVQGKSGVSMLLRAHAGAYSGVFLHFYSFSELERL